MAGITVLNLTLVGIVIYLAGRFNLWQTRKPALLSGKELVGDKSGAWRYRIGNYRLIADIRDDELVILALEVGHRKAIYK